LALVAIIALYKNFEILPLSIISFRYITTMSCIPNIIKSALGSTGPNTPSYKFHSQVGETHPDPTNSLFTVFVPHYPVDKGAFPGSPSHPRVESAAWLEKKFPQDRGRFKRDTRNVFTSKPFPGERISLLGAIGDDGKYNQPQKSDIIYSVKGEKPGKCYVETIKGGHFCSAPTSWVGEEIAGTGDVCLNLEYHGSTLRPFDRPSGNAKKCLKKQIGLTTAGSKSWMSNDVIAAWIQKRFDKETLCWVTETCVSLDNKTIEMLSTSLR
jgi:hypothetical protein